MIACADWSLYSLQLVVEFAWHNIMKSLHIVIRIQHIGQVQVAGRGGKCWLGFIAL